MAKDKKKKIKAKNTEVIRLGKRIKALRIEKGYSNYENFAFDHDLPRAQFGRYEKGEDIRFSSLMKVIKAFNMTPEEFFAEGF